jgi:hypothetical protein
MRGGALTVCLNAPRLRLPTRPHLRFAGASGSVTKPLLVFVASAALLGAVLPALVVRHQATTGDGGFYVRMARDPGAFVDPPWGFRILMPWLVSALPGSTELGFEVVTVLSLALAAAVLFALLRRTLGEQAAWWGVGFFLVSGAAAGTLRNPYLVDPLAFVFVIAGFTLAFSRRWLWLALVLAAGVLAKETVLFVVVVGLLVGLRCRPRAPLWQLAAVIAAPLFVYLLLHRTSLVFSERREHSYLGEIRRVIPYEREKVGLVRAPIQAVLYSFGPLWVAAVLGFRHLEERWRASSPYLVLVLSGLAVGEDWPRLLGYAFPIVIAAAAAIPISIARRALLATTVLLDSVVLEALPSSAAKQVALLAAFAVGVLAITGRRTASRRPDAPPDAIGRRGPAPAGQP